MWRHIETATSPADPISFAQLIECLPQNSRAESFGTDIDDAHARLLDPGVPKGAKVEVFLEWASRNQPCMFGRFGSMGKRRIGIDVCWLDAADWISGDQNLAEQIRSARREWKVRASRGEAHGLLVVFNSPKLAYARPSRQLIEVCIRAGELYLVPNAAVMPDVIYTEALPLASGENQFRLFKAGMNFFYTGCHGTRNHDRRVPGGLMLSINSVGHYANSLVKHGYIGTLPEAVHHVRDMAWRSIGNGGIGMPHRRSTSWHNPQPGQSSERCPMHNRPAYVPQSFDTRCYSALYHTDVLVPSEITQDATALEQAAGCEIWPRLTISYFDAREVPLDHEDYGMFHGHPVGAEGQFSNPWLPLRPQNVSQPPPASVSFSRPAEPPPVRYLREMRGIVCRGLNAERATEEEARQFSRLRDHINSLDFPCVGARTAVARSSLYVGLYDELGAAADIVQHHADLEQLAQDVNRSDHPFVTFAAVFVRSLPASEAQFENALWEHLQKLHHYDRQRYSWDPSVEQDPDHPRFSYSAAGKAWFVVGLNPASSRRGRYFPCAVLVFNAHQQFESLRARGLYGPMSTIIRQRDLAYSGSINPNLASFGEASEARQYSGRAVEAAWHCPLEVKS